MYAIAVQHHFTKCYRHPLRSFMCIKFHLARQATIVYFLLRQTPTINVQANFFANIFQFLH